jgi:hypothetical protein
MTIVVGHEWNPIFVIIFRLSWVVMVPLTMFVLCDDPIWSQMFLCFGHNLLLTALASDMALMSVMMWQ